MNLKEFLAAAIFATMISTGALAQNPVIYFTDLGTLSGNLPQKLLTTDVLKFSVTGKDAVPDEQKNIVDKAKQAIARIDRIKLNRDQLDVLDWVYDIKPGDLDVIRAEYVSIRDNPGQTNLSHVPGIDPKSKYFKVTTQDTKNDNKIEMKANDPQPFPNSCELKYNDQNALNLTLTKTNLFRKAVFNWYTAKSEDFRQELPAADIATLTDLLTQSKPLLEQYQAMLKALKGPVIKDVKELRLFKKQLGDIMNLMAKVQRLTDLSNDKEWILYWFWYGSDAMPALNPFSFKKDEELSLPDTSSLSALRMTVFTKENYLKNLNVKEVPMATATQYIKEIAADRLTIATQLKAFQRAQDQQSNNKALVTDFAATLSTLNKGMLIVSDVAKNKPIFWMRHHNALNQGEDMNTLTAEAYTEEDRVFILTHNLTANQQAVIQLKYTAVAGDQSQLGDLLTGTMKSMSGVSANAFGGAAADSSYIQLTAEVNRLMFQIKQSLSCLLAAEYLVKQNNPKLDVKEASDPAELYHTQKDKTPAIKGSQQAVYTVSIGTKAASPAATVASGAAAQATMPVDTFKYRINKLYRIFPMAGIAYTLNHFGSLGTNATQTGPGNFVTEKQTHFFIGLKVFLQKTDIRNTSFITGRDEHGKSLVLSRIHLDAAFDLGTPLNNIYTGAGIDPWPGFAINFGVVWNKYDHYQYSSGQNLHQTLYRPGFYLALSTDVAVIAQLTKLLNLSK